VQESVPESAQQLEAGCLDVREDAVREAVGQQERHGLIDVA